MSPTSKNKRSRGRRRGGSRSPFRRKALLQRPSCEICNKPINDITTAIAKPGSNLPIHFECALSIVSKELKPGNDEKIVYLGKGSFAAVEFKAYRREKLVVRRQIAWENVEERGDWRIKLRSVVQ